MIRIESIEDEMRGVVTYKMDDRRFVSLDVRDVREYGAAAILRNMGFEDQLPAHRVPVMQYGRRIGTVPGDFDLAFARSRSPFYDVRPGDLVREGDVWLAARNLGASDLDCLEGFRRDDGHDKRQEEIRHEVIEALQSLSEKLRKD